jgi:hypothetical protein
MRSPVEREAGKQWIREVSQDGALGRSDLSVCCPSSAQPHDHEAMGHIDRTHFWRHNCYKAHHDRISICLISVVVWKWDRQRKDVLSLTTGITRECRSDRLLLLLHFYVLG